MRYPQKESIIWQFDTARFRVVCHVEPEDMDPADSFQFEDDIEAVRSGSVEWFCAFVSVWYGADEDVGLTYLAHDVLGGCAYKSFKDFLDRKGYFGDMVDAGSVGGVLDVLAEVCSAKADHVRENWQDEPLAESWDKIAALILNTQQRVLTNELAGG